MDGPLVSFVIPCYKLARYLRPCLDSILGQTYKNLELLIMDDCSPDDTAAVAASYSDARVLYVRNDTNLGHLKNYNKGTSMARGDYIWLISADDCLRSREAVERYVSLMEQNPRLAYVFCPAMGLDANGDETGLVQWTRPFTRDVILDGRGFLAVLAVGNCVSAPSVMVRRRCFEAAGMYPADLPHAADWYLWCAFAFCGDVAYVDEPLVCYRSHGSNMSTVLTATQFPVVRADQAKIRWRLKGMAEKAGFAEVASVCAECLVKHYALVLTEAEPVPTCAAMAASIEAVLEQHARADESEVFRNRIYGALADKLFGREQFAAAAYFYGRTLRRNPAQPRYAVKLVLLKMGRSGLALRRAAARLRDSLGRGGTTPSSRSE